MVNGYGYDALRLAVCKSLIDVVERQEYDQNKEYEISPLKLQNADSPFLSHVFLVFGLVFWTHRKFSYKPRVTPITEADFLFPITILPG